MGEGVEAVAILEKKKKGFGRRMKEEVPEKGDEKFWELVGV